MSSHNDADKLRALALQTDPPAETLARIEHDFQCALPSSLRDAWLHVLAGADNPLRLLTGERLRADFTRIVEQVNGAALQLQIIDADPKLPFVLLPFAQSYGDDDFVALDLSKPSGNDDFIVRVCLHDVAGAGPFYQDVAEWMAFEQSVQRACGVLDAMWSDTSRATTLRQHVVRGEFDEFEALSNDALDEDPQSKTLDYDVRAEAIERAWENADPVEITPSLPPL